MGKRKIRPHTRRRPTEVPATTAKTLTHGAFSKHFAERYSDLRTREGKHLQAIMDGLVEDLGGQDQISTGQRIILNQIRSKLIVVLQISRYTDRQTDVVGDDGELMGCLGKSYLTYHESIRRDIQALHALAEKRPVKAPDLDEYLKQVYGPNAAGKDEKK